MRGPGGEQIQDFHDKTSEKFEFVAHRKGVHRFCFSNKSPYHETIDFDVHIGHFTYYDEHAKDGRHSLLIIHTFATCQLEKLVFLIEA